MPSPVLQVADRYSAMLARQEAGYISTLLKQWSKSWAYLNGQYESLAAEIQAQGGKAKVGQIVKMQRYKTLMVQTSQRLAELQAMTNLQINAATDAAMSMGATSILLEIEATMGAPGVAAYLNKLPKAAVEQLMAFLQPDSPLWVRLQELAPTAAQAVSDAFVGGVVAGKNPVVIAREVQTAFCGGLTDAMRFVRTAQLWSYREASRATMLANGDVVEGWIWRSGRKPNTCGSCIAMDGTIHPISEPLNDHHNGGCSALPKVIGYDSPITETGEEWFNKQAPAMQQNTLGKGKYDAWSKGEIKLGQLTTTHDDPVYGPMRIEASMKDLAGVSV